MKEEILIAFDAMLLVSGKYSKSVSNTALVVFEYSSLKEFGEDYQELKAKIKQTILEKASKELRVEESDIYISFNTYEIIGRMQCNH